MTETFDRTQLPAESLPGGVWDALVVGAGPAGSACAVQLATLGHRVLLADKDRFPRTKICGDGILSDAAKALERLGVLAEVQRFAHQPKALALFSPSGTEFEVPGDFFTIRRSIFDSILARRAIETGAIFCLGEIADLRSEDDGTVTGIFGGTSRAVRAQVAVLATGARASLPRRLGMADRSGPDGVAMRCYVESPATVDRMIVSYDRSTLPGYAWSFPLGKGQYNIGCGVLGRRRLKAQVNVAEAFRRFTATFPVAVQLLEGARALSPPAGAPLRSGLAAARPLGPGRILATGEAIGSTLPLTGEGIGKAMETGEIAALVIHDALQAGDFRILRAYVHRLRKLRRKYRGYQIAESWLTSGWLGNLVARRAKKSPYLRAVAARVLGEAADPRELFSIWGIFRSFLP